MADSTLPKRRPNGTIMPGNALNPTGRPRIVREIQTLARSAAPDAFAKVVALSNSKDERVALAASQEILNRAFGKPLTSVQSDVRKLDMAKLWAMSLEAMSKGEAGTGAGAEPAAICESAALPIIDLTADETETAPADETGPPDEVQTDTPLPDEPEPAEEHTPGETEPDVEW